MKGLQQFILFARDNAEIQQSLRDIKSNGELIAFAHQHGFEITAEELSPSGTTEISLKDLESVSAAGYTNGTPWPCEGCTNFATLN